jgi:poly(A) polymerase
MTLANLKKNLAEPYFDDLFEFQRAIQMTDGGPDSTAPLEKLSKRIKELGDVDLRPDPLLNGHDLIRLGAVPGPTLGQLSQEMYIAQLEGILQNTEQAEQWAKKWLQKHREIE